MIVDSPKFNVKIIHINDGISKQQYLFSITSLEKTYMVVDNRGIISYIRVLKEDLTIYKINPSDGPVPDFKAGQFVTIGLHIPKEGKIIRRAYSIASPPEQKKYFELIIRWVRKPLPGRLTTELFNITEGDEVLWVKPTGIFTINHKKHDGMDDNRRMVSLGEELD